MKKNDLLNFAQGKSMADKRITCTVKRVGENDIEIRSCSLFDMDEDLIMELVNTKDDVEFFKAPEVKAMMKERIEVCRQKLLKFDINTVTVDEQDLDL